MSAAVAEKRARFRALHTSGCFLLPNPWDAGSALRLETMGFAALATSSAATAWVLGKQDYEIGLDDALTNMRIIAGASALPVNADFENGFADRPDGVAANVALALATGIAGLSVEDRQGDGLRDDALAADCIAAARGAIDAAGGDAILVGRTEIYLTGKDDPDFAIRRLKALSDAGADCLYAPGVRDIGVIREMVAAVAPKPINVLLMGPDMDPRALAEAGVRRISSGGGLAWAAWSGFETAAQAFKATLAG